MSIQFKSGVANRLANVGWDISAVVRFARYPKIYSIAVNLPLCDGIFVGVFGADKQYIGLEFKLELETPLESLPDDAFVPFVARIPKELDLRLAFLSVEYNQKLGFDGLKHTPVEVVYDSGDVYKFVLEKHSQVRNVYSDAVKIINYAPLCASGLRVPDIIDKRPLKIGDSIFSGVKVG